jgi:hypothetical protein
MPASAAGAGAGAGAAGTAGTAGKSSTSGGSTYRLTGGDDKDLQDNVGKRVEVTGTMGDRGSSSSSGAAGAGAGASGSSSASGPTLRVSSIRATGASCSE